MAPSERLEHGLHPFVEFIATRREPGGSATESGPFKGPLSDSFLFPRAAVDSTDMAVDGRKLDLFHPVVAFPRVL